MYSTKLVKLDGSLGFLFPDEVAKKYNFKEGQRVLFEITRDPVSSELICKIMI